MNTQQLLTFQNIQEAINYVLDNNLFRIDLVEFETNLTHKLVHNSKDYNTCFVIDEQHILSDN